MNRPAPTLPHTPPRHAHQAHQAQGLNWELSSFATDAGARGIWLGTFGLGFLIILALLLLTVTTPAFYGDLSRIGRVSEAEFGWRLAPPSVPAQSLQGAPIAEADVLVIGDSFSQTHRWQSVLQDAGYRVTSTFWGQYGEDLCADLKPWLQQAGFQGRLVIVESVERLLDERIRRLGRCERMRQPLSAQPAPLFEPPGPVPGLFTNWGATIATGWHTYRNTRRALREAGDTLVDNNVLARVVPQGCERFSNRFCHKSLFFREDETLGELGPAHAEALQRFAATQPGLRLMWMVIPNKTSAYLVPGHSDAFVQALQTAGLGPDLFAFAREQRSRMQDFYMPNDTHLSIQGQLALGKRMLEEVRRALPAPAPPLPSPLPAALPGQ